MKGDYWFFVSWLLFLLDFSNKWSNHTNDFLLLPSLSIFFLCIFIYYYICQDLSSKLNRRRLPCLLPDFQVINCFSVNVYVCNKFSAYILYQIKEVLFLVLWPLTLMDFMIFNDPYISGVNLLVYYTFLNTLLASVSYYLIRKSKLNWTITFLFYHPYLILE